MTIHALAYAKLNLQLDVCDTLPNGYHTIRSIVQTIDLADHIAISLAPDVRVLCSARLDGTNIAEVALRKLLVAKQSNTGVSVWIEKRIPMGAGLGGGSSNAAAVLSIVNRLIPPLVPKHQLVEIAREVGSDVPLFLTGGCLSLVGTGHPERQHALRSETFVVFAPDIHCSTKDVYNEWQPGDSAGQTGTLGINHLAGAAERICPDLGEIRLALCELGSLYSGMTGSGSAFFAAFSDGDCARAAYEKLTRQDLRGRVYYCQPTQFGFVELPACDT